MRAGLKDGAIQIAPNGDVELLHEGTLRTEMKNFSPPPVPSSAPPPAPSNLTSSSLVTVAVISSSPDRRTQPRDGSESASIKVQRAAPSPPTACFQSLTPSSEEKQRHQLQHGHIQLEVTCFISPLSPFTIATSFHCIAVPWSTLVPCSTPPPKPPLIP